jgi:hypothetical protein
MWTTQRRKCVSRTRESAAGDSGVRMHGYLWLRVRVCVRALCAPVRVYVGPGHTEAAAKSTSMGINAGRRGTPRISGRSEIPGS